MGFKDCGYKSMLGTCFYDRVTDLERLRGFEWTRTLVIYGPRGAGKSELVRYYANRILGGEGYLVVYYDAGGRIGDRFLRGIGVSVFHSLGDLIPRVLDGVTRILESLSVAQVNIGGLVRGVRDILAAITGALGSLGSKRVYIVVDEAQRLQGYMFGDRVHWESLVSDLESTAGLLAKHHLFDNYRLIIVSSEGFVTLSSVKRRLLGYSSDFMVVEGMDVDGFIELYNEYCGTRGGCRAGVDLILKLVGPLPGYIDDIEGKVREGKLEQYVREELARFEKTLLDISWRTGVKLDDLIKLLEAVIVERKPYVDAGIKPTIIEQLISLNYAYETFEGNRLNLKPSIKLYETALKLAANRGRIANIELRELLEES